MTEWYLVISKDADLESDLRPAIYAIFPVMPNAFHWVKNQHFSDTYKIVKMKCDMPHHSKWTKV